MDFKEIKNTKHYLYNDSGEFAVSNPSVPVRHNWRHGEEGEWVFTDDGFVCQILKKSKMDKSKGKALTCVRTVCGTFIAEKFHKEMLGENGIAENIYTFSGKNIGQKEFNDRGRTSKELLFARYVAQGKNVIDAYKLAYPNARDSSYIKNRTEKLLKTETIQKMLDKEILAILEKKGETPEKIIQRYTDIADGEGKDSDKLGAIRDLAKMSGLFDRETKKSEQVTVWAGFSPEQLEGVKKDGKPELIAHAEKDEKE